MVFIASLSTHQQTNACFLTSAAVSNATVTMGVWICLQDPDFISFDYIMRSGIDGS